VSCADSLQNVKEKMKTMNAEIPIFIQAPIYIRDNVAIKNVLK
jgi:hypothetical protein